MPKTAFTPTSELSHRWFLAEWAQVRGKIQADAQRELGWSRSTASGLWNGSQGYTQQRVDEAARWLEVEPHELLMRPADALKLRQLRVTAQQIAAEQGATFVHDQPTPPRKRARV